MKFGKFLKGVRESNGLSLRDLARIVGTSAATLSRIERGLVCDPDAMARVFVWLMTPEKKVA
jgi:predicted transcriptional regulator